MISDILAISAPLLLATLGALGSEYAGVLAIFMEGAISIGAFACAVISALTGSAVLGVLGSAVVTASVLYVVARFTERFHANPFITGIAVNFLAIGVIPRLSFALFGTQGVVQMPEKIVMASALVRTASFPFALALAALFSLYISHTRSGLALRNAGSASDALAARGLDGARYRALSWVIAAIFASLAGSSLTLGLGAFVPSVSAGRGWTALAAVYLGYRNPLLCVLAVLVFASASYLTDILQGSGMVPGTMILGLPYALALLVFVVIRKKKEFTLLA
jgi:simple sugar transport system permease protein